MLRLRCAALSMTDGPTRNQKPNAHLPSSPPRSGPARAGGRGGGNLLPLQRATRRPSRLAGWPALRRGHAGRHSGRFGPR
uniref:Uncharacterized protein n=1 Tax=Tanacetum cinerariifolium TaxID=118510 RepID=A0A699XC06_TANCI|nr:hypothetical protein [Tanacetum cinerariifolium]